MKNFQKHYESAIRKSKYSDNQKQYYGSLLPIEIAALVEYGIVTKGTYVSETKPLSKCDVNCCRFNIYYMIKHGICQPVYFWYSFKDGKRPTVENHSNKG